MSFSATPSGLLLPNSVKSDNPPSEDFSNVRIFARNGFVIFERPDDTGATIQTKQTSVEGAKIRYARLSRLHDHCKKHESKMLRDRVPKIAAFLERLKPVIEQAEEQGPFSDASMRRARVRAQATTVSVPRSIS